ncbi:MAG: radical SAM family heme chaperone HemW [Vulcanibacillus sp.]
MTKAIYVHIPFCVKKCNYCDFNSYPLSNLPLKEYLEALKREMEMIVQTNPTEKIMTIFIGGGTPTILKAKEMEYLLYSLERFFPSRDKQIEFTIEANPGTLDLEKLNVMKDFGVNRISLGVQAFQDNILSYIGRIHTVEDIYQSIETIKKVGFENISIDLMFGLPGQSVRLFKESLIRFFELKIPHVSVYSLIIEEGTQFYSLNKKNELSLPSEEDELTMYLVTMNEMGKNNYRHYEISNFSKIGYESKHNINYWRNNEYIGLGSGAHGYIDSRRYENIKGVNEYIKSLSKNILPRETEYIVSNKENKENMLMLGLRMLDGVKFSDYQELFNEDLRLEFKKQISKLDNLGLILIDNYCIKLSEKGLLYGNEVFAEFIHSND